MIEAVGISKSYVKDKNKIAIFEDASFTIPFNGVTAIIGKNGSGKTTLLNLLAGVDQCCSGSIVFNNDSKGSATNNNLCMLMPSADLFFDELTMMENLLYRGCLFGLSKKNINHDINSWASKLHIDAKLDRFPEELSYGERRRFSLLAIHLCPTEVYLLDEPTMALDVESLGFVKLMVTTWIEKGKTVIFSTHSFIEAFEFSNFIVVVNEQKTTVEKVSVLKQENPSYTQFSSTLSTLIGVR